MANLNDFKLINKRALRYFEYLNLRPSSVSDIDKKRIGFYLLVLESVTGIKDIDEIIQDVIDTNFCKLVLNEENDDLGIDAVNFDKDEHEINLFNFKYREKFKPTSGQKINNISDSMKFLSFILETEDDNLNGVTEKTKEKIKEIREYLNSDEIWTINLFMVSNENNPLPTDDIFLSQIKKTLDMNVECITLDKIINFISDRPDKVSSDIIFDRSSVMKYEESELSSSKSYLVSMSVLDLIRITCIDKSLRDNHNISDYSVIKDIELDQGVLFDNVRGYLGDTKYNKNIIKTLSTEPSKFFMYNNGLTITAKNIIAEPKNANKKLLMHIEDFQIVNGGQTLRSIYRQKNDNFDEEKLANAKILIRIFQTEDNSILTNNIAEFTNSQNAISSIDLKSVSNLQIQIEQGLKEYDILYVRKVGDTGEENKSFKYRISMERMGQIIYSKKGYPDRATNQKRRIFEEYYDDIFNEDFNFEILVDYIKEYYMIKKKYEDLKIKSYEQKYFYILYLNTKENDIIKNIKFVEESLQEYKEDENLSTARKLIQKGYRDFVDEKLKEKI
ncbi:AIPR family protein [Clostridium algidicarnis]|uniref:AIPR family protein n=1 Tax=Clostridium algidicarnis TaxID=37659 RepID=UPI001C0B9731|nr:AIPR family protein [Clostridium algidicarnis]MBU3209859.1 AIPR family protein [Clostridium algidicarnis]